MKKIVKTSHKPFASFFLWWIKEELGIAVLDSKKNKSWEAVCSEINKKADKVVLRGRHDFYNWFCAKGPPLFTRPYLVTIFGLEMQAVDCLISNYPLPQLTQADFEYLKMRTESCGDMDYEMVQYVIKDRYLQKHWGNAFGFHTAITIPEDI